MNTYAGKEFYICNMRNPYLHIIRLLFFFSLGMLMWACQRNPSLESENLFRTIPPSNSGIEFENTLVFQPEFNIYRYRNFYNGGGVAIGDINNDGLPDIYFTSNMGENKLYLNKGNLKFKDITAKAGVQGSRAWAIGVAMADVNGDGLLDIYVCNSGIQEDDDKRNELFINNGDLTLVKGDDILKTGFDLVKIDVEGSEIEVLHGMSGFIGEFRPKMFIEVGNRNSEAFFDWMGENVYTVVDEFKRYKTNCNYLIVPNATR